MASTIKLGVLQVGGAHNVPGTLHKVPGHAVICGSVPGTFSAPSVKYAHKVLREEGYTVRVYNDDGTVAERRVAGERMVMLEPDVFEYFSDAQAVNQALRTLIALVPEKRRDVAMPAGSVTGGR